MAVDVAELADFLRIARAKLESQGKPEYEIKILTDRLALQWLLNRKQRR